MLWVKWVPTKAANREPGVTEMRSNAVVRRIGVSTFIVFLALVLHGIAPASSRQDAASAATPKPSPSHTVRPRVTHTPRPQPSSTSPYPGGGVAPAGPNGDSFFRVSDTEPAPGIGRDLTSMIWILLALFTVGLVVRWFFIAARNDDAG
jgi:hypothetical protein